METYEPVGDPGNRVTLAAPCRVLDEIVLPYTVLLCIADAFPDGIELVVPGEDYGFAFDDPVPEFFLFCLDVDKPGDNVQETVALKHFFPEICRFVTPGICRVSCPVVIPAIEREKYGILPAAAWSCRLHRYPLQNGQVSFF